MSWFDKLAPKEETAPAQPEQPRVAVESAAPVSAAAPTEAELLVLRQRQMEALLQRVETIKARMNDVGQTFSVRDLIDLAVAAKLRDGLVEIHPDLLMNILAAKVPEPKEETDVK